MPGLTFAAAGFGPRTVPRFDECRTRIKSAPAPSSLWTWPALQVSKDTYSGEENRTSCPPARYQSRDCRVAAAMTKLRPILAACVAAADVA
jgi:hypothetical protein